MQLAFDTSAHTIVRPHIVRPSEHGSALVHTRGITVDPESTDADSQTWRFKRHRLERKVLLESLPGITTTPKGKQRFLCCGDAAAVEFNPQQGRYRVRARTCGHRWCPACRERFARDLRARITEAFHGAQKFDLKFITLTLRSEPIPLREQVSHLLRSFRKLRQTQLWQRRAKWGVAILEITINPITKLFHPHLHCVVKSGFLPRKALSKAWEKATSGSCVVDIRAVENSTAAVHYMTKYVSKGTFDEQAVNVGIDAAEQINAIYRKKTVLWFGNKPEPKEAEDSKATDTEQGHWIYLCSFERLLKATYAGLPEACAVLQAIDEGLSQMPQLFVRPP